MDNLNADQVKAWTDAVGPTLMAVILLLIALRVLVWPMVKRERKESHDEGELSVYHRLVKMEERVEILWDDWKAKK